MVLWSNLATDISEAIQRSSENVIVVVLRFGKIKVWKGILSETYVILIYKIVLILRDFAHNTILILLSIAEERSVSNAYNVSDVEINPFGPEVEAFMSL